MEPENGNYLFICRIITLWNLFCISIAIFVYNIRACCCSLSFICANAGLMDFWKLAIFTFGTRKCTRTGPQFTRHLRQNGYGLFGACTLKNSDRQILRKSYRFFTKIWQACAMRRLSALYMSVTNNKQTFNIFAFVHLSALYTQMQIIIKDCV